MESLKGYIRSFYNHINMYFDNKVIFIALPLYITTRDFKSNNQDVAEAQTSVFLSAAFIKVFL